MLRSLLFALTTVVLFVSAGPAQNTKKSALDKATLEAYVRHLYVMDSRITIQVSDPKPSAELPGFSDVTVHAALGPQTQDFKFLVSKDGSKILQASVYDIASNPFKSELDKLNTTGAPNFGTQGAPVVIVEFSDFECPFCKLEAAMLRANIPVSYPTQVHVYFKEFPLESLHPWAKAAAIDSRCVFRQTPTTEYWEFHDLLFSHQTDITAENLKEKVMEWAKLKPSIDSAKLASCMDTRATEAEVNASQAEGRALAVDQTPTLFVNGRRVPGQVDWPALKNIIDYEIEYQKTAKNAGEDCGCDLKLSLPGQTAAPKTTLVPPKK
ncbi:MAG TPA: thioredoxin domain-containing protein [Candidatus Sulfopaludibacter sp.]|nr:thioredoxin domain-containing protein [Candidatus Sulfopaludibacter sp.]